MFEFHNNQQLKIGVVCQQILVIPNISNNFLTKFCYLIVLFCAQLNKLSTVKPHDDCT